MFLQKGTDSASATIGKAVEVRGIAKDHATVTNASFNTYDTDFDTQSYEQMLDYYHGMCAHLTAAR